MIVAGVPYLGKLSPDAEDDGQPTIGAFGDDVEGIDDEDGLIQFAGAGEITPFAGQIAPSAAKRSNYRVNSRPTKAP